MVLAPYYRRFDLPWEGDPEAANRFRRLVLIGLAIFAIIGGVVPWLKLQKPVDVIEEVPDRLARLMVEERKPPPPPPPPPKVEEPKPEEQPKPEPQPEQRQAEARRKAEREINKVRDELADLRRELNQPTPDPRQLSGPITADSRSDRSLITSRAGTGSAGVTSAASSRGFGGGAGELGGHNTGTVQSNVASIATGNVTRGGSGKPGRSAEEIEQEFDRNKGAIYSLYVRAVRDRADLQGKVVLEFTIAPEGAVTSCRIVSSELNHPELEGRICARVRLIRFPARDVAAITTTKPIDFFPQG
jgi:periplasmic protein TonB